MPSRKSETPVRAKETKVPAPARDTATFTPYFWLAYNEIVQPRRFDWYLIEKWLPELGALGFAIVKTLRNAGYNNRETGIVRSEIRMEIAELAARCGVSEPTIHRQFRNNEALKQFVARESKFRMKNGHPEQCANLYRVCMDDPIHPDDTERYEILRCEKEMDREDFERTGKKKTLDNHFDTQGRKRVAVGNQIDSVGNQIDRAGLTIKMIEHNDVLPPEVITKESNTPNGETAPPINPPGEGVDAGLPPASDAPGEVWRSVLSIMEEQGVLKRRILTHFGAGRIQLKDLTETTATLCGPVVLMDSARGKFAFDLEKAFQSVTGHPIEVQFTTGAIIQ